MYYLSQAAQKNEEKLTVAFPSSWGELTPAKQTTFYAAAIIDNVYDTLVRRGSNGVIEPNLALSWTISNDYKEITFKIDTSRKFSDGSNLSPEDIKRSWEEGLKAISQSQNNPLKDLMYSLEGYNEKLDHISGISIVDSQHIKIKFKKSLRLGLDHLSSKRFAIAKYKDNQTIGTGPYVIKETTKQTVLLEKKYFLSTRSNNH